jgi:hypothetical protein
MSARDTNKARVEALWTRVQALPRDDHWNTRGDVLAHFFGALEAKANGYGRCSLGAVLDSLERAVVTAEASAARRTAA